MTRTKEEMDKEFETNPLAKKMKEKNEKKVKEVNISHSTSTLDAFARILQSKGKALIAKIEIFDRKVKRSFWVTFSLIIVSLVTGLFASPVLKVISIVTFILFIISWIYENMVREKREFIRGQFNSINNALDLFIDLGKVKETIGEIVDLLTKGDCENKDCPVHGGKKPAPKKKAAKKKD